MTEREAIIKAKEMVRKTGKGINIIYDCDYYEANSQPKNSFFPATDHEADTFFCGCRIVGYVDTDLYATKF